jgi:hypothetical protein
VRSASVAWATADELALELRQRAGERPEASSTARPEEAPGIRTTERDPGREDWSRTAAEAVPKTAQAPTVRPEPVRPGATQERPAEGWLIPPYAGPDGRESLGRGTGAGEVAAAVAADTAVQREREARWSTCKAPTATRTAQRAASAIGPSLERIGEAEARAERTYRTSVRAQRGADATGIPRLSAAAAAAVGAMCAAKDDRALGETWRAVQKDEQVAIELEAFERAVSQRFGDEGIRAMMQAARSGRDITATSVSPDQQSALDLVASITVTMKAAERAGVALAQRQAESERQGQRRGLRM